jgi:hypothetical protein
MTGRTRYSTRAVAAMELPRLLAGALARPVLSLRARRGGRRRFERAVAPFGERAVQILDADGYLVLVVENAREQDRILAMLAATARDVDVTAWDAAGERVPVDAGIE